MAVIPDPPVYELGKLGASKVFISWLVWLKNQVIQLSQLSGFSVTNTDRVLVSDATGAITTSTITTTQLETIPNLVPYSGAIQAVDLNDKDLTNIDDLNADTAVFGAGSDYSQFEADGTLVFNGAATVWDDSMVPATAARTAAADLALQTLSGGVYAPRVDLNDEIYSVIQFPHSIKTTGTVTIKPHIHLINQNSIGASNYNVAFDLEYLWGNIGSVLAGSSQSDKRCSFQNASALTHKMLTFDDINASASQGGISSLFFCRVKRRAAGANAYNTNDIFWGGLDIHFEKDTVGSRDPTAK